jgi:20S proteasome alpha/beta subunit
MTTALAIKCKDGIVLASDSQGTQYNSIKSSIDKVFEINKNMGIVGAGENAWTTYFVENFKTYKKCEKCETERELTNYLYDYILEVHQDKNKPKSVLIKDSISTVDFNPEILWGTKLKDDEFYIHCIRFSNEFRLINENPIVDLIYESKVLGSGASYAILAIETIREDLASTGIKLSDLPIKINVGIAMHIISQANKSDLGSSGYIQIGIIDNTGFSKIHANNQPDYYYKAIKCLSELSGMDEIMIKESLPVSVITLL